MTKKHSVIETVNELVERAQNEDFEKQVEALIKINASLFDKAAAYTNLVIVAGYAVFYTVWSKSEAYLPSTWFVAAALLVTFSALTFICFEVFKLLINRETFKCLDEVVKAAHNQISNKIEKYELRNAKLSARVMRAWIIVFPVTLTTGLCGAVILLVGFGRFLLNH